MVPLGPTKNPTVMSAPRMVERYLRSRGIKNERLLSAMATVPRHRFVPEAFRERAYSDHPLPIGFEQTITQPYVVARMTEELVLEGREKVLEIGTGSGYQTAVLAELAKSVFSVDRIHTFVSQARKRLEELGYHNISIRVANGKTGWSEFAPYDRILVAAAASHPPEPLLEQLAEGGILVLPVIRNANSQEIVVVRRSKGRWERRSVEACSFVPLVD